jgi:hypothetical protein
MTDKQRMSQWAVGNGYVQMTWPEPLSVEDMEDVEAFVAVVLKGIRRRVYAREKDPSAPNSHAASLTQEKQP